MIGVDPNQESGISCELSVIMRDYIERESLHFLQVRANIKMTTADRWHK